MYKIRLLMLLLLFSSALIAQQNPFPKTISVTGSAELEIVPDEIYVLVTLREYDKKGAGKVDLETLKTDFLHSCRLAGLADSVVTIVNYQGVNPNWWRGKKNRDDLQASISYQLIFSNSKMMDDLVAHLDDDGTLSFQILRVNHSKVREIRRQLKIQAVKAAREKADYLSEAINEKVGEAITIAEPQEFSINNYANTAILNEAIQSKANEGIDFDSNATDFTRIKLKFDVTVLFSLK